MVAVLVGGIFFGKVVGIKKAKVNKPNMKKYSYVQKETRIKSVHDTHFLTNNSGHIIKSCFFVKLAWIESCFTVTYEFDQIKASDEGTNKTILRRVTFYLERKKTCILVSIIHTLSIN